MSGPVFMDFTVTPTSHGLAEYRIADAVGLSILSGAHMTLFAAVIDQLRAKGAEDIVVFGGGIIPEDDIPVLEEMGVARIFTPGTPTHEIVQWVQDHIQRD